jgi:SCY1-like protein 1
MNDDFDSFDSPGQSSKQPATTTASTATFDDDGEPDFAGWLAAQSQKKPTKALPKGLSKSSAAKKPAAKPAAKPIAAKKIDMKPKETDDDDGWGDGW